MLRKYQNRKQLLPNKTPAEPTDINKQTIPETLQETAQVTEQTGGISRIDRI